MRSNFEASSGFLSIRKTGPGDVSPGRDNGEMDKFATLDIAAHSGANGHNHKKPSTHAQNEAGNYAKGRGVLHGLRIAIESPRGTLRHWKAEDGTSGSNLMKFHYGYIMGTLGNDGDELDVSIGPMPDATRAYVVNQHIGGKFDEHKIMLGFPDKRTAEAGYLSNYNPGWPGLGSCTACSISQLKWWIAHGDKARPLTQDQLPDEGTDTMEKVLWDSANLPLRSTLEQVLYRLRAHDGDDGLLFDAVSMADILGDADGVLALDALVIPMAKLQTRMALLQKVLDRAGEAVKVAAMQVSDPFTQRGSTNVAVIYELTDGQTVSVFFHNPDVTPKKIAPGDDLISWKWMLNKKDITVAVAPEKGRDLNVRTVAARIMMLAEKNSARFATANGKRTERMQAIAALKTELETKEATLAELEQQVAAAQAARDEAGLDDPVDPQPQPGPTPEPEPAPAATPPNVDNIKAVITTGNPMPSVSIGVDWIVMNAPRPLMGTETTSNGEFLDGRFYAAIDPADGMAQAYVDENVKQSASVVFDASKETLIAMALQTVSSEYVAAYMEMDEAERSTALSGFINALNGKTYGELKALAAKGMPTLPEPQPEPEPAPTWRSKYMIVDWADRFRVAGVNTANPISPSYPTKEEAQAAAAAYFGGAEFPLPSDADKPAEPQKEVYRDYLIYPTSIVGKIMFAVQSEENRAREAAGERTIGGDSLHDTIEQARAEVDRLIIKAEADAKSQAEYEAREAERLAKEAAARAEFEDVDGFTDGMSPMQKEKALQALNAVVNYRGTVTTRKAIIREKVAAGFYMEDDETDGRILTDGDVFQGVKQITKTGLDYAAYLISKRPTPAVDPAEKEAQEAQEADDGDFLALAAEGNVDFYDKAVTDRLAALAKKYTDPEGAYLDMIQRAKTAAKNFFIAEFKKKVG